MDLLKAFVLRKIPAAVISEDGERKLYSLVMIFTRRWKECRGSAEQLRKVHEDWFGEVVFPLCEDPSLNAHQNTRRPY